VSNIAVWRHDPDLVGRVASAPTVWRTPTALIAETLTRVAAARAAARRRVWAAGLDPHFDVIDIEGTVVTAHSDKEGARPTSKPGFGFSPLFATLDATGEPLAIPLRPGHAGAGTVDPIPVLDAALAPRPVDPATPSVIVRTDRAGCSPALLAACDARGVRFIVGHPLTEELAATLMLSALATHRTDPDIAFGEALSRGRGRCEQVIRDLQDTGLAHLPAAALATHQAWLTAVLIAGDLLAWLRGIGLAGALRTATPARLRDTLLHVAGRLIRTGRRVVVRVAAAWLWSGPLLTAAARGRALPRGSSSSTGPRRAAALILGGLRIPAPGPGGSAHARPGDSSPCRSGRVRDRSSDARIALAQDVLTPQESVEICPYTAPERFGLVPPIISSGPQDLGG
jgi:hypothetical protein